MTARVTALKPSVTGTVQAVCDLFRTGIFKEEMKLSTLLQRKLGKLHLILKKALQIREEKKIICKPIGSSTTTKDF